MILPFSALATQIIYLYKVTDEKTTFNSQVDGLDNLLPYFNQNEVPSTINTSKELVNWLAKQLEILSNNDFSSFLQLLYRIDVSEEKVKKIIAAEAFPFLKIAELIFEREQQKQLWRKKFKSTSEGSKYFDDKHEKWD